MELKSRIGLIGNNGVGKTHFILNILGLENNFKGEVLSNRKIISKDSKHLKKVSNRNILATFQDNNLFEELTIKENILLFCSDVDIDLLKKFDLLDYLDEKPLNLSGGIKQRVNIVRCLNAITKETELVIFDEPFNNLSEKYINILKDTIKNLSTNFILVSHNKDNIISLCEDYIYLEENTVIKNNINESYYNPKTLKEARILGSVSTLNFSIIRKFRENLNLNLMNKTFIVRNEWLNFRLAKNFENANVFVKVIDNKNSLEKEIEVSFFDSGFSFNLTVLDYNNLFNEKESAYIMELNFFSFF